MNFTTSRRARFWDVLRIAALAALATPAALGQNRQIIQPDCVIDFVFTAAGQTAGGSGTCGNNVAGVYEWRITYKSTGFSALSLVVQSAPDSSGSPGTWVTFVGSVVGVNPNTATDQATTDLAGFNPWVRVMLTSKTGTGTITGELYGCRQPGCSISGAAVMAVIPTPVPVDGPTAAGSPPTTPPVLVAGQDGAPGVIRTIKTDAAGELIPANASSADSDGVSNTEATPVGAAGGILYPRVFSRVFNGTTWDRMAGNTTGVSISNASSALADAVSNTELALTAAGGGVVYPRALGHYFNGTSWDRARGNTTGAAPSNVSGAAADGVSNTQPVIADVSSNPIYARNLPFKFNGATWDREFGCTGRTNITLSAGTDVVIATGVAATNTHLCMLVFSGATVADFTIRQGTGTTCLTNTLDLAGIGQVAGAVLDMKSNDSAMTTTIQARDMCLHVSASVTVLGYALYATF